MEKKTNPRIDCLLVIDSLSSHAAEQKNYLEAITLVHAGIEIWLKIYLKLEKNLSERYWGGNQKFSTLIDYCEISGLDKKRVEELRYFNGKRNELIHNAVNFVNTEWQPAEFSLSLNGPIKFETWDDKNKKVLDQEMEETYRLGREILDSFLDEE